MMAEPVTVPDPRRAPYRFTVDDVDRMIDADILPVDLRAELIEGQLIEMPAPNSPHARAVDVLNERLVVALHGTAIVRVQNPLRLDRYNEPHPDLAVVRLREDRYGTSHPGDGDTLLVIEVCATSHWYDRNVKLPIYARSGVPEVWLIDLPGRRIELYLDVSTDTYASIEYVEAGDDAKSATLDGFALRTDGLF